MDSLAFLLIGGVIGFVAAWLIAGARAKAAHVQALAAKDLETGLLNQKLTSANGEIAELSGRLRNLEYELKQISDEKSALAQSRAALQEKANRVESLDDEVKALQAELGKQQQNVSRLLQQLDSEQKQAQEKLELLNQAKSQMEAEFKNLAQSILDEKLKSFEDQGTSKLKGILEPVTKSFDEFKTKVEHLQSEHGKDSAQLREKIDVVTQLNRQLTEDAKELTSALRGQSKTQGNWGEMILSRVLEKSGLEKDREFFTQRKYRSREDREYIPDAVVMLPDDKQVVIDSKVSLEAHVRAVNATDDASRASALKEHLASVWKHVDELAKKEYQRLQGLNSVDFTVMFIPNEAAYVAAIAADETIWERAWEKDVLCVSPSTLYSMLRTIHLSWVHEKQARNVKEITDRAEKLYEKFVGFVADLKCIGDSLADAQSAYDGAFKKLSKGSGNLVGQAEKLRELGARPSKLLPKDVVDEASLEQSTAERALSASNSSD